MADSSYVSTRAPFRESRLDWLKRVHRRQCPECNPLTPFAANLYRLTAYCPTCEQVWTVQRVSTKGGTHIWQHEEADPL